MPAGCQWTIEGREIELRSSDWLVSGVDQGAMRLATTLLAGPCREHSKRLDIFRTLEWSEQSRDGSWLDQWTEREDVGTQETARGGNRFDNGRTPANGLSCVSSSAGDYWAHSGGVGNDQGVALPPTRRTKCPQVPETCSISANERRDSLRRVVVWEKPRAMTIWPSEGEERTFGMPLERVRTMLKGEKNWREKVSFSKTPKENSHNYDIIFHQIVEEGKKW